MCKRLKIGIRASSTWRGTKMEGGKMIRLCTILNMVAELMFQLVRLEHRDCKVRQKLL